MHSHEYKLTVINNSRKIHLIFFPSVFGWNNIFLCQTFWISIYRSMLLFRVLVCVHTRAGIHVFFIYEYIYIKEYIAITTDYGNTHIHIYAQAHTNPLYVWERYFSHRSLYVVNGPQQLQHSLTASWEIGAALQTLSQLTQKGK